MFDKEAIQELSQAEAISAAQVAVDDALKGNEHGSHGAAALPENFKVHDLENYMTERRRMRGTMNTSIVADFAGYTKRHAETGAAVFIDRNNMKAVAVLNLGTKDNPGHADSKAVLALNRTAEYEALRKIATGHGISQQAVAEFMEDWPGKIICSHEETEIATAKAIASIRSITIEALRQLGAEEQQLSASKTTFEKIEAKGKEQLPTIINFTCLPYQDIALRTFQMRLGILTGGNSPAITLRIIKIEEHEDQMAQEFADLVSSKINDSSTAGAAIGVHIGTYQAG